jgi:DNA-binding response OmpR family regulator
VHSTHGTPTFDPKILSSEPAAVARRALVADDDPDMSAMVAFLLRRDGFIVTEAACGEDLWDLINGGTPAHLVITDLQMRDISGMDVLARMRKMHSTIPVILMTGFAGAHLHLRALRMGAVAVLTKPFTAIALRALVDEHVRRV